MSSHPTPVIALPASPSQAWPKATLPTSKPVASQSQGDKRFAYSLWRRALLNGDERAWCVLYTDYRRQVCTWVKRQLSFAVDETTMQTLVDDAFVKMAGTFRRHPEKFADYPNVAALLGLLRLCAQRVVQDYVTDRRQDLPVVPLEAIDEPAAEATPTPSTLWAILEGLLHDEKEWLVVTKLLVEEAKPRHLYAEQSELFASVDEINTIRERVKGRLQRNGAFRHYLHAIISQ
jgi:hypothetical protein